jgi:predicted O-methyltransferase YrrM
MAALAMMVDLAEGQYPEDSVIVEIGSLVGKSTIAMASVSSYHIVAIDPHEGDWVWTEEVTIHKGIHAVEGIVRDRRFEMGDTYDRLVDNLNHYGVRDKVEIIKATSEEAAKAWDGRKICMMFIDGLHSREMVQHDFEAFQPYFVEDATIFFHDVSTSFPGVLEYVSMLVREEKVFPMFRTGSLLGAQVLGQTE